MKGWMGRFRALFLLGSLMVILSACGKPNLTALEPKGESASDLFDLMMFSIYIMLGVFVVVMAIYTFVLIRYRQKKGQENVIPKQTEGNKILEFVWTIIPIILIIALAIPTIQQTFILADKTPDEGDDNPLTIEVTGKQFWWHFDYKDQKIQTSEDLYIPTGKKVFVKLKSADVIHSFWVPSVAGKMDANPGKNDNTMYLKATEEGVYYGKCTELCGPSHSLMDFKVVAVSPEEFDKWVSDMQAVKPDAKPATASAQEGQQLFQKNNCIACHAIGSSPANVGPNLTDFGNRSRIAGVLDYNKDNLVKWIMNPAKVKPGNKMAKAVAPLGLTEEDAGKIADYLMQLKPTDITPESAK